MDEAINPISLSEETKRRYLNYALSVITSRALPDVRDGLKPVQRRILYAMQQEGYRADSRPRKCVGVTGEVTKSYHPHGDQAVYEALVRMAQDFTLRYPLVHGEGNFGSVDGDGPAAQRYTECKLMPLAEELMAEITQKTVDFRPNFDGEKTEPVVLPARFPGLLANGSQGIAVGMAANIPPHNIGELIKATLLLIDQPDVSTANLVNLRRGPIKGPDFPLGGRMVIDQKTLVQIYETGHGGIRVQGEWKVEEPSDSGRKGKSRPRQIIISSIPYGVNKGNLLSAIGDIVAQRRLPMVLNLVDESSLDNGMRIVLEIKEDASAEAVMAYLFKHTPLQDTFHCNFTCLVPVSDEGAQDELRPRRIGVKEMLTYFLDFRIRTVRRRFQYQLDQLLARIHILEGFQIIFNDLDKALRLIRKSTGRSDAAERLRANYPLDEIQSFAIVDLNLYRIGSLEIDKILEELRDKKAQAAKIQAILGSEKKLIAEVRKELEEFDKTFADKRRTRVADDSQTPEFDPDAYIVRENANVVLTKGGWIKRVGRLTSASSTRVREGDEVLAVVPGSTIDSVIFISSDGFAYTMRIVDVPASTGYGEPLAKFFRLRDGVSMVAAATTDARFTPTGWPIEGEPPYLVGASEWQLVLATKLGNVIRVPLTPYLTTSTKAGRRVARLVEGDQVVLAYIPTAEEQTMFLIATDGHLIHFPIEEINLLSGVGKGVRGIRLTKDATCLGGMVLCDTNDCMQVENSTGKVIDVRRSKYQPTSRGGKGHEIVKRSSITRIIPQEILTVDWASIGEPDAK